MLDFRVWRALRHPSLVRVAFLVTGSAMASALIDQKGGSRENSSR